MCQLFKQSLRETDPSILTLLASLPDPNVPMTITIKNIPSLKESILQLQETKSIHNKLVRPLKMQDQPAFSKHQNQSLSSEDLVSKDNVCCVGGKVKLQFSSCLLFSVLFAIERYRAR